MQLPHTANAHAMADHLAREAYGRLLAYLAARWRDVAAAEDALSEAFAAALESWPRTGVPHKPEAWLLTVARRKLSDAARGEAVRERHDVLARLLEDAEDVVQSDTPMGDERLRLMLVRAHPAIDASVRPALMLQLVLGVEVKQMSSAFLLSTEALTKRLVRAKAKIKLTGMRFEQPDEADLEPRLHAVLESVYAAYFIGREGAMVGEDAHDQLRSEAVYLARVIATALPANAEALGFLALLLFCESRRAAQVNASGEYVPLLEQDATVWDHSLMRSAYELLSKAAALDTPGPYQLEAAIQGAHCYRAHSGAVPWREIAELYEQLVQRDATVGALVGRAVARAYASGDALLGVQLLREMDAELTCNYQPYWAAMGHLLLRAGEAESARRCLQRALELTVQPKVKRYLQRVIRTIR